MNTPQIIEDRLKLITRIAKGGHEDHEPPPDCTDPEGCAEELRSWIYGQDWSDHNTDITPPDIAALVRACNDYETDDAKRTARMMPVVTMGIVPMGSRATQQKRAWMIVDWDIRWRMPRLLRALGLAEDAIVLESLSEIVDQNTADVAIEACRGIGTRVREQRDKARAKLKAKLDARDARDARADLDARDARADLDALDALAALAARAALDAIAALDALDAIDAIAALDALDALAARASLAALDALDALDASAALDADPKRALDIWTKVYEAARVGGYWRAREVADALLGPEVRAAQKARWGGLVDEVLDGMRDLILRLAATRDGEGK